MRKRKRRVEREVRMAVVRRMCVCDHDQECDAAVLYLAIKSTFVLTLLFRSIGPKIAARDTFSRLRKAFPLLIVREKDSTEFGESTFRHLALCGAQPLDSASHHHQRRPPLTRIELSRSYLRAQPLRDTPAPGSRCKARIQDGWWRSQHEKVVAPSPAGQPGEGVEAREGSSRRAQKARGAPSRTRTGARDARAPTTPRGSRRQETCRQGRLDVRYSRNHRLQFGSGDGGLLARQKESRQAAARRGE